MNSIRHTNQHHPCKLSTKTLSTPNLIALQSKSTSANIPATYIKHKSRTLIIPNLCIPTRHAINHATKPTFTAKQTSNTLYGNHQSNSKLANTGNNPTKIHQTNPRSSHPPATLLQPNKSLVVSKYHSKLTTNDRLSHQKVTPKTKY